MTVLLPPTLGDALEALHRRPDATVLAGGTDLMVGCNYGTIRPTSVVSLRRVRELEGWHLDGAADEIWIGARMTYRRLETELAAHAPALAQAARTVGSPQIRTTGTIGGNLATGSPAGDTLPVLASLGATIELVAHSERRRNLPIMDFLVGPKHTALEAGELISGVRIPVAAGPQEFLKIGTRNAMVISVASCALVTDTTAGTIRATLGSVGPVPMRCTEAETFIESRIDRTSGQTEHPDDAVRFGELCAAAARPIDDHRSTADYRRRACAVLARRALNRVLEAW